LSAGTRVGLPESGDKGDRVVADEYELLASFDDGRRAAEEHMVDWSRRGR
jgi:hypothetical protein